MKWSGRLVSALYYLHDDMLGTPQIATDSNQAVHLGKFQPVVDAQRLAGIVDAQSFHRKAGAVEDRRGANAPIKNSV